MYGCETLAGAARPSSFVGVNDSKSNLPQQRIPKLTFIYLQVGLGSESLSHRERFVKYLRE